jgi:hypothetical protein
MKSACLLGGNGLYRKGSFARGPIGRNWPLFFCVTTMVFGLSVIAFSVSCSHTSTGPEKEVVATVQQPSSEPSVEPDAGSEATLVSGTTHTNRNIEDMEAELELVRAENKPLKEEIDGLRSEVIMLHQALADANQTIYSLNRKLDAIFKPEIAGE